MVFVLIETSWNVKVVFVSDVPSVYLVLIETSWNVKWRKLKHMALITCINRNIVECKEVNYHIGKEFDSVLIETSWNVKHARTSNNSSIDTVLIETSWNVKSVS